MSEEWKDIRIDTTEQGLRTYMRLVHLPTGIIVAGETERSRLELREELLFELRRKVESR